MSNAVSEQWWQSFEGVQFAYRHCNRGWVLRQDRSGGACAAQKTQKCRLQQMSVGPGTSGPALQYKGMLLTMSYGCSVAP